MEKRKNRITGLQLFVVIIMWYLLASSFIGSLVSIGIISDPSRAIEGQTPWWIVKLALCAVSCIFVGYYSIWGRTKVNHWIMPAVSIILMLAFQIPAYVNGEFSTYADIIMLFAFGLAGFTFSFAFYKKPVGMWICYLFGLVTLILACTGIQVNEVKHYASLTRLQMAASIVSVWTPAICVGAFGLSQLFNRLDRK